ncbi:hypothetical protein OROGR_003005 [Orobanche gracilis]
MSKEGGGKAARSVSETTGDNSSLPPPNYYGTFQGVANYQPQHPPPSHSVMGFPQPALPPGYSGSAPRSYPRGYQIVPGSVMLFMKKDGLLGRKDFLVVVWALGGY